MDADSWSEVAGYLNFGDLLALSYVNKFFYKTLQQQRVEKHKKVRVILKRLMSPDNIVSDQRSDNILFMFFKERTFTKFMFENRINLHSQMYVNIFTFDEYRKSWLKNEKIHNQIRENVMELYDRYDVGDEKAKPIPAIAELREFVKL